MARRARYWSMVEASQDEALLGVRLYNDPAETRAFEAFVVHMHLAWLYLLHAVFTRDGVDFRYHRRDNPRLLEKIDGEVKYWELARCVREHWPERDPERANIEFFIQLRNRIEHRHAQRQDALIAEFGGLAQALILNYEEELTGEFGADVSLAARLKFPVFVGSFSAEGERSLRRLRRTLPGALRSLSAEFRAGLDDDTLNDSKFEFRLRVVNELAPKDPDALAIQFTRYEDLSEDEKQVIEELGRKNRVIVRTRNRPVVNQGLHLPKAAVALIQRRLSFDFNMHHFVQSWKHFGVRPGSNAPDPAATDARYCIRDSTHGDYLYTDAYVEKVVKACRTEGGYSCCYPGVGLHPIRLLCRPGRSWVARFLVVRTGRGHTAMPR